jgi:hypothetical protein
MPHRCHMLQCNYSMSCCTFTFAVAPVSPLINRLCTTLSPAHRRRVYALDEQREVPGNVTVEGECHCRAPEGLDVLQVWGRCACVARVHQTDEEGRHLPQPGVYYVGWACVLLSKQHVCRGQRKASLVHGHDVAARATACRPTCTDFVRGMLCRRVRLLLVSTQPPQSDCSLRKTHEPRCCRGVRSVHTVILCFRMISFSAVPRLTVDRREA